MAKKRRTTGRKPNWFRERCSEMLSEESTLAFVESVLDGTATEERLTKSGRIVAVKASIHDRMEAVRFVAGYGVGLPQQSVDLTSGGKSVRDFIIDALGRRAGGGTAEGGAR